MPGIVKITRLTIKRDFVTIWCVFLNTSRDKPMALRPPLNALHVFCVVVEKEGFRQAAQALHITPGAVSRQVQVLEQRLKEVLFDRSAGASVTLTPAGRHLYMRVADKMAALNEIFDGAGNTGRHESIMVDTSVTVAMHWLIPLLPAFNARYPNIHVHVRTVDGDINPLAPVDVFIRRDAAELRGLPAQVFMAERAVLVSSPVFLAGLPPRRSEDMGWLVDMKRIGTRSRRDLWPKWSAAHGLDAGKMEPMLEYDNTVLAIQAAVQGLGALVVPEAFVAAMLGSGALALLHPARVDTGTYSFAIGRQHDSARVAVFTDWLRERSGLAQSSPPL
jgi:LysR family transcriptional regulator, glycine cleavage system transcriptional activator